jgi:hypothetical protein
MLKCTLTLSYPLFSADAAAPDVHHVSVTPTTQTFLLTHTHICVSTTTTKAAAKAVI